MLSLLIIGSHRQPGVRSEKIYCDAADRLKLATWLVAQVQVSKAKKEAAESSRPASHAATQAAHLCSGAAGSPIQLGPVSSAAKSVSIGCSHAAKSGSALSLTRNVLYECV